jgi:hypothetical protein
LKSIFYRVSIFIKKTCRNKKNKKLKSLLKRIKRLLARPPRAYKTSPSRAISQHPLPAKSRFFYFLTENNFTRKTPDLPYLSGG